MKKPQKKIKLAKLDHEVGQAGASDAVGGLPCAAAIVIMFFVRPD